MAMLERFGDHFEVKDESTKLQFHWDMFGLPERMLERLSHIPIKSSLALSLRHLPNPIAFLGPLAGHDLILRVKRGEHASSMARSSVAIDFIVVRDPEGGLNGLGKMTK